MKSRKEIITPILLSAFPSYRIIGVYPDYCLVGLCFELEGGKRRIAITFKSLPNALPSEHDESVNATKTIERFKDRFGG